MDRDSFVDRSTDLARLADQITPGICLTVMGTEGVGKSRLVAEVARQFAVRWPLGVRRVDLRADASALYAPGLGGAGALVVLDGCDGVSAFEREAIATLLASGCAVVATSRDVLGVSGERAFALAPLPGPRDGATPVDAAQTPAMQLFLDRVADAGGALDARGVSEAAALVRLLDAIPLALELTAARVADLGLPAVHANLKARVDERVARGERVVRRDLVRLAVTWAWEALEPWARAALLPSARRADGAVRPGDLDLPGRPGRAARQAALRTLVQRGVVRRDPVGGTLSLPARLHEHVAEMLSMSAPGLA